MKISQLFRATLAASLAALGGPSAWAHVSYSGRDFGTFTVSGAEPPKVITIGNVSSAFGWAAATDADFGDSHRTRAFRVTLTNPAVVTLRVQGVVVGAAPALPYPGFSIYKGLCHVAPKQSDHDSAEISALYLASLGGVQPKAGALIALGNFTIGDDPTYVVSGDPNSGTLYPAELVTLNYIGHAADGTPANYGTTPGIQGDGTGDNDVQKSFVLPAGDYSIFIGGGDYSAISNGPTWPNYGITATFSVATLTAAPTVNVPANITTTATSGAGAVVSFSVSGTDAAGNTIAATPNIASGSTFPLGTTTVNVATTDAAGQTSNSSFTVTVNASTDAALASLSVAGAALSPAFDPNTTNYTATVGNVVASASLTAATAHPAATTSQTPVNPVSLVVGSNPVTVHVTAQDGSTTKDYTVNVKRTVVDTTKPAITISTPGSNVTGTFTVSGKVKELVGLASLTVSLNSGAPQHVTLPTDVGAAIPWSISGFAPENGVNSIIVTATDYNGNVGTMTKNVTYLNTTLGGSVAGVYNGVIVPSGAVNNDTSGFFTITVGPSATFSGKVTIGGVAIPISGLLNNAGQAKFKPALGTNFNLIDRTEYDSYLGSLSFSVAPGAASGTLSTASVGGSPLGTVTAKLNYYDGKTPGTTVGASLLTATSKGMYNVALSSKEQTPVLAHEEYPQGDGATSLTLMSNGSVTLKGNLADGTAFSAAGKLAQDLTVALHANLYRKAGSIAGSLKFDTAPADSDVADVSDLLWVRPALPRASYYPAGFAVHVDAVGTKYTGVPSVNFTQGDDVLPTGGNAQLVFSDGALSSTVIDAVNVNKTTGKVTMIPTTTLDYKLSLTPGSGAFSGFFKHSDNSKPAFKGVLLNKGANTGGFGYFLSTPAANAHAARLLSGAATVDFDKTAWDGLAAGLSLGLPVLTLDEFFNQAGVSSRTSTQILSDEVQATPSYLHQFYAMNGSAVTNLAGRTNKPTTFSFTPGNAEAHSGAIGLAGIARFSTILGPLVYGDYTLQYDADRQLVGGTGWYLKGNIPPAAAAFDLVNVNVVESPGFLSITGDLAVSYEVANFLYGTPADAGKDVGNFTFSAAVSAPTYGSTGQSGGVSLQP